MTVKLRPLDQQTIVITGASSGIGLATARMAAAAGANVVAFARDEPALTALVGEITSTGGQAIKIVADVADESAVNQAAETAAATFGRIDTWVNNAGVGIYGRAIEITLEDARRLMDINFFGQVHGSLAAVRHLEKRLGQNGRSADGYAMALVNVGSTESDRALPLHSHYAASKHAVKGFTNALRTEVEEAGLPISVTLVKPGSIDTPFIHHAANYMGREANYPPPVYAPEVVARVILHAATHSTRDLFAGGGGWLISTLGRVAPRLTDLLMERQMFRKQQQDAPPDRRNALHEPGAYGGSERGGYPGMVRKTSIYTTAELHPVATMAILGAAVAVGIGLGGTLLNQQARRRRSPLAKLRQAADYAQRHSNGVRRIVERVSRN